MEGLEKYGAVERDGWAFKCFRNYWGAWYDIKTIKGF